MSDPKASVDTEVLPPPSDFGFPAEGRPLCVAPGAAIYSQDVVDDIVASGDLLSFEWCDALLALWLPWALLALPSGGLLLLRSGGLLALWPPWAPGGSRGGLPTPTASGAGAFDADDGEDTGPTPKSEDSDRERRMPFFASGFNTESWFP
mmetsp:Transcript_1184/g.3364  ORF Transcript_1184/g.3364 Transcript_1184/m.3364 type:complete len:150 (-) Transcript_1184:89-538(-)